MLSLKVGWMLAVASLVLLVIGPMGTRFGLWSFVVGFGVLGVSVLASLGGVMASLIGGFATGRWGTAAAGVLLGLAAVAIPIRTSVAARGLPPIHEITTDFDDPPAFAAILPLRAQAPNPPDYGGPVVAAQQQAAFPDIQPLTLDTDPSETFDRALAAARDNGWDVVAADKNAGRIEAVATTFWFGFKDDVVIRVREEHAGSRIDIRSKSRVGIGDLGANARRVRDFLDRLSRR